MDLPCFKWQKHVEGKWTRLDLDAKKCFTSLQEIDDVFELGLTQTTHEDVDFLRGISKDGYPFRKDPEEAARSRERGNASFKYKDYTSAALHYSQGVCNAAPSSEQLSLCYANRSAALFYLHCYQECLADIDRALEHGYPPHLQTKLQTRRTQCLNHLPLGTHPTGTHTGDMLSKETRRHPDLNAPKLSSQNGQITSISSGAAVHFCVEKGRHLVATKEIAAGELVLQDRPYCCVLVCGMEGLRGAELNRETEQRGGGGGEEEEVFGMEDMRCHFCMGETWSPVPCEGCGYSRYCSDWCRTAAWEEHHCWECPMGAELRATGVMAQLALRVALKAGLKGVRKARKPITDKVSDMQPIAKRNGTPESHVTSESEAVEPSSCYHGDSYLSVYHLLPHLNDHAPCLRFLCAVTVATLYRGLSRAEPPPTSWQLGGGPSQNRKGSDQSQPSQVDGEEECVGWDPELTLLGSVVLRHMLQLVCNGQAVSALLDTDRTDSAVQSSQEVRVATAIFPTLSVLNHSCRPNTSLSFNTGTGAGPAGLGCPSQDLSSSAGSGSDTAFCGQRVAVSQVNRRLGEVKGYLEQAVELMEEDQPAVILSDTHPLQGQVSDASARAYATMGDWRRAAWQLERSMVAITAQYGDTSVELGHQLFKLVQLHFNGGAPGPALAVLPRARHLLSLHCGPRSPEGLELQAMEDCLQGAL
ncbi:SET and MYND domain-containing protein 4 [Aplochiton taeniatus]